MQAVDDFFDLAASRCPVCCPPSAICCDLQKQPARCRRLPPLPFVLSHPRSPERARSLGPLKQRLSRTPCRRNPMRESPAQPLQLKSHPRSRNPATATTPASIILTTSRPNTW